MARRLPVLSFLDPGTRRMGYCCGTGAVLPTCGAWRFPFTDNRLGEMLEYVEGALEQHIETHRPDLMAYESPILRHWDKLQAIRKTYSIGGLIELVARRRGIECLEVDLRDVKKELSGHSGAEKHEMVAAARQLGVDLPQTLADGQEDAADALGGFLVLLRLRSPVIASRYDALLHSQRESVLI